MKMIEAPEVEESGLDVAPMIDILFTLIIFFLATTTFQAQEREEQIQLPRHGGSSLAARIDHLSLMSPGMALILSGLRRWIWTTCAFCLKRHFRRLPIGKC